MTKKNYGDYLEDIFISISDIQEFISQIDFSKFCEDKKTSNAVIRSLEVIGEAAKNIPASIRKKYPDVPWKKMAGMRDKLIHEYFGIDFEIVWGAITEDLPPLKSALKIILRDIEKSK